MVSFGVEFSFNDGTIQTYTVTEEEYAFSEMKDVVQSLYFLFLTKSKASQVLVHEQGLVVISNENLRSVNFDNGIWEVFEYNYHEIEEMFNIKLR